MEFQQLMADYNRQRVAREEKALADKADLIGRFSVFANSVGIDAADIRYSYCPPIGIVANSAGILSRLLPDITKDKDGLYSISELLKRLTYKDPMAGHLFAENFVVLFSSYFRRGYGEINNWAPRFLDAYWPLTANANNSCYILLDENRVRIDVDGMGYKEEDTWYGPRFNDNIEDISDGNTKLSIPQDIPAGLSRILFSDVQSWDISWSTKKGLKTFQAMEFKADTVTVKLGSDVYYPVRYLHSEYDLGQKENRHIDGAIQFLTKEQYNLRKQSDFNVLFKTKGYDKPRYLKLFKINGATSKSDWIELVSQFFQANPLVHEYFTGSMPEHIVDIINKLRAVGQLSLPSDDTD